MNSQRYFDCNRNQLVDLLLQKDEEIRRLKQKQSVEVGGKAEYPEPFEYFLASMPLCAAFYMRKFCQQRH